MECCVVNLKKNDSFWVENDITASIRVVVKRYPNCIMPISCKDQIDTGYRIVCDVWAGEIEDTSECPYKKEIKNI